MRSKALCVQVYGVIEFSIEKAPLIKLKNKKENAIKKTVAWDKELPSKFVIKVILINVGLGWSYEGNILEHIIFAGIAVSDFFSYSSFLVPMFS